MPKAKRSTRKYKKFLASKLLGKTLKYVNIPAKEIMKGKVVGIEINKVRLNTGDMIPMYLIIKNKQHEFSWQRILSRSKIYRANENIREANQIIFNNIAEIRKQEEILNKI